MEGKLAIDWRLKGARYRLEGLPCTHCGRITFPPRTVCHECGPSTHRGHPAQLPPLIFRVVTVTLPQQWEEVSLPT